MVAGQAAGQARELQILVRGIAGGEPRCRRYQECACARAMVPPPAPAAAAVGSGRAGSRSVGAACADERIQGDPLSVGCLHGPVHALGSLDP